MARPLSEADWLALVDALADGEWHSGEVLAAQAGITRAALAKRIAHLVADWQLAVETRSGLGYRLAAALERLDGTVLTRDLDDCLGNDLPRPRIEVATSVDSTNRMLLDADPAHDPQALFAEVQSAGRGRRGRAWASPFGANLYLSLAWTFAAWPPQLGTLPLAVGVAVARALHGAGLREVKLKWPNDLRIGPAKLGGILIEQRGEAGGACRVVVGLGLNVAMTAAQAGALDQAWTSVHAACARAELPLPTRHALAVAVLSALTGALHRFAQDGFESFRHDWNRLDATAGQPVTVTGGSDHPIEGIARGIDDDGALVVQRGRERLHLHAGDVSVRLASSADVR